VQTNVIEGIQAECKRVRELIPHYEAIGPVGIFGKTMLNAAIQEGEAAIASGDVVRMIRALTALRDCQG
jgi:hypothetical protein